MMRENIMQATRQAPRQRAFRPWKPILRLVDRKTVKVKVSTPATLEGPEEEESIPQCSINSNCSPGSDDDPTEIYFDVCSSNETKIAETANELVDSSIQNAQNPFDEDSILQNDDTPRDTRSVVSACPSDEKPAFQVHAVVNRHLSSKRGESKDCGDLFDDGLWDTTQVKRLRDKPNPSVERMNEEEVIMFNGDNLDPEDTKQEDTGLFSYSTWAGSDYQESERKHRGFSFKCQNMDQVTMVNLSPCVVSSPAWRAEGQDDPFYSPPISPIRPPTEIEVPANIAWRLGDIPLTPPGMTDCQDLSPLPKRCVGTFNSDSERRGYMTRFSLPTATTTGTPGVQSGSDSRYPNSASTDPDDSLLQMSVEGEQLETPPVYTRRGQARISKTTPSTLDYSDSLFGSIVDSRAPVSDSRERTEQQSRDVSSRVSILLDPPDIVRKVVKEDTRAMDPATRIKTAVEKHVNFTMAAEKSTVASSSSTSSTSASKSPRVSRRKWLRRPFHRLNRVREDSVLDSTVSSGQNSSYQSASEALKDLVADASLLDDTSSQESRAQRCMQGTPHWQATSPSCRGEVVGDTTRCPYSPRLLDSLASLPIPTITSSDDNDSNADSTPIAGDLIVTPLRFAAVCNDVAEGWGLRGGDDDDISIASRGPDNDEDEDFFKDLGIDIAETVEELARESKHTLRWLFRWRKWRN